jgi:malate dehydrogenase (oxaloacetate-decarboxylating)
MKIAAAHALASAPKSISADEILPDPLDKSVARVVAEAVRKTAIDDGVSVQL